jgi:hypothetical protein
MLGKELKKGWLSLSYQNNDLQSRRGGTTCNVHVHRTPAIETNKELSPLD